jgi:hypothetical protein
MWRSNTAGPRINTIGFRRLPPIWLAGVATGNERLIRLAEAGGRPNQRLQHCLQIDRRPADDFEHVSGGGLLLQRFAQLVEQAHVLDGDDGLAGEVLVTARSPRAAVNRFTRLPRASANPTIRAIAVSSSKGQGSAWRSKQAEFFWMPRMRSSAVWSALSSFGSGGM